jgi:hypothetical protein
VSKLHADSARLNDFSLQNSFKFGYSINDLSRFDLMVLNCIELSTLELCRPLDRADTCHGEGNPQCLTHALCLPTVLFHVFEAIKEPQKTVESGSF